MRIIGEVIVAQWALLIYNCNIEGWIEVLLGPLDARIESFVLHRHHGNVVDVGLFSRQAGCSAPLYDRNG